MDIIPWKMADMGVIPEQELMTILWRTCHFTIGWNTARSPGRPLVCFLPQQFCSRTALSFATWHTWHRTASKLLVSHTRLGSHRTTIISCQLITYLLKHRQGPELTGGWQPVLTAQANASEAWTKADFHQQALFTAHTRTWKSPTDTLMSK